MLVRHPTPQTTRTLLGVLSIALLVVSYIVLSNGRKADKQQEVRERIAKTRDELDAVNQQLQSDQASDTVALEQRQERLAGQLTVLEEQLPTVYDRSVPTFRALYHDGLMRVIRPQGLRKDQYWLWMDVKATATRLFLGLSLAVLFSILIGVLMGAYTPIEAFFVPPLSLLAKVPPTAMLAVFFVLVGTTLKMYITMIIFGTLPTLAQAVFQSARKDVPESLVFKAYTLGASHVELIWNVIYKQILPRIIDAVRLQIGPAMVLLIAAEWMVADEGFGYRLRREYQKTDMTVVYLYVFLLGLAGFVLDYLLSVIRRWLCPWFGE